MSDLDDVPEKAAIKGHGMFPDRTVTEVTTELASVCCSCSANNRQIALNAAVTMLADRGVASVTGAVLRTAEAFYDWLEEDS